MSDVVVKMLQPGRQLPRGENVRFERYKRMLEPGEVLLCIARLKEPGQYSAGMVPMAVPDDETLRAISAATFTMKGIYRDFDLFAIKI